MVRKSHPWLWLLAGMFFGPMIAHRFNASAQDRRVAPRSTPSGSSPAGAVPEPRRPISAAGVEGHAANPLPASTLSLPPTVQDVLFRPYRFPFSRPTSLVQLCVHLKQTLRVPVVLDLAALGRQNVDPEDTVQLDLDGVRLKTGLKLLLDQVGLTYHVVTEDNLLIITDREGSEDPLDRVWSELRSVHRELHDVQDAIDSLTESLTVEKQEGPRMRKPTIIEELPDDAILKEDGPRMKPEGPARKPNGATGPDSAPPRVPLGGTRRSL